MTSPLGPGRSRPSRRWMTPSSTSASACALALAGQHAQGVAPVEEAHQRARRLGHPRLEADARLQLGLLQSPWPAAS